MTCTIEEEYLDVTRLCLEFPELSLLEGDHLRVQLLRRVSVQAGQRNIHGTIVHPANIHKGCYYSIFLQT